MALARGSGTRCVPRARSFNGLAVRGRARPAGAQPRARGLRNRPLTLGHLLSIAAVVAFVVGLSAVIAINYVRPLGAAILVLFGIFRYIWPRAHPRWVAMRVNSAEATLWSFLMSSAHGAGLMLFPLMLRISPDMCVSPMLRSAHPIAQAAAIVLLHTGAMITAMGAVSIFVYQYAGLADPAQRVDQSRYDLGGRAGRCRSAFACGLKRRAEAFM